MAKVELVMPKMGESIMEATILTWLKKEGGRNISGEIAGDYINDTVREYSDSEIKEIENDFELREHLFGTIKSGNIEKLKELLDRINDINAIEPWSCCTSLMLASRDGHLEIVEYLLAKGADINFVDKEYDNTALTYAVRGGHAAIVKLLVENGASTEYLDLDEKKAFGIS